MNGMVFGNSYDLYTNHWQVWVYDEESDFIHPLARYTSMDKGKAATFDLVHDLARLKGLAAAQTTLDGSELVPVRFSPKQEAMLKLLVKDAVANSEPGGTGQAAVTTRETELDQLFVVRFD